MILTPLCSSFNAASTPIVGRGGVSLQEMWEPYPAAYLSLCVPRMPNMFLFLGPNGGPGAGSFIAMLEVVMDYTIKCARKMQIEHISSMEVAYVTKLRRLFVGKDNADVKRRENPFQAFSEHVDKYFAGTIFTYKVRSNAHRTPSCLYRPKSTCSRALADAMSVSILVQAKPRRWSNRRSLARLFRPCTGCSAEPEIRRLYICPQT